MDYYNIVSWFVYGTGWLVVLGSGVLLLSIVSIRPTERYAPFNLLIFLQFCFEATTGLWIVLTPVFLNPDFTLFISILLALIAFFTFMVRVSFINLLRMMFRKR